MQKCLTTNAFFLLVSLPDRNLLAIVKSKQSLSYLAREILASPKNRFGSLTDCLFSCSAVRAKWFENGFIDLYPSVFLERRLIKFIFTPVRNRKRLSGYLKKKKIKKVTDLYRNIFLTANV